MAHTEKFDIDKISDLSIGELILLQKYALKENKRHRKVFPNTAKAFKKIAEICYIGITNKINERFDINLKVE